MRTVPHLVAIDGHSPGLREEAEAAALTELRDLVDCVSRDLDAAERAVVTAFDPAQDPAARAAALDHGLLLLLRLYDPGYDRANLATIADRLSEPAISAAARRRCMDAERFDLHVLNIPHLYRETFDAPYFERCRDARDHRVGAATPQRDDVAALVDQTAMIVDAVNQTVAGRPRLRSTP